LTWTLVEQGMAAAEAAAQAAWASGLASLPMAAAVLLGGALSDRLGRARGAGVFLLGSALASLSIGWLSGLPNAALPLAARDEDFAPALKSAGVRYVLRVDGQDYGLEQDESSSLRREVERAYRRLEDPRRFRKVHEEPAERAAVYEPL